jgi:hypothetical protein
MGGALFRGQRFYTRGLLNVARADKPLDLTSKEVEGRSSLSVSTETSDVAEKRTGGRMTVRGDPFLTQISTGAPGRADD